MSQQHSIDYYRAKFKDQRTAWTSQSIFVSFNREWSSVKSVNFKLVLKLTLSSWVFRKLPRLIETPNLFWSTPISVASVCCCCYGLIMWLFDWELLVSEEPIFEAMIRKHYPALSWRDCNAWRLLMGALKASEIFICSSDRSTLKPKGLSALSFG